MVEALAVKLEMDEVTRGQLVSFETILEVVNEYVVDSPAMAQLANDELRTIKTKIVKVDEMRKGFIAPARQIIAHAEALFDPALKALRQAETLLKDRLGTFAQEQQRLADESRRAQEAAERKIRQEAEQKAAAERARAEQEASEKRRQATVAEEARKKAVAEGDSRAAVAAAAQSARLEEEARARQEEGEIKAAAAQLAAAASVSAQAPTLVAAKIDGFSMRDSWQVELERDEAYAIRRIAMEFIGVDQNESGELFFKPPRAELIGLLAFNAPSANKMAKALKNNLNVPGLRAVNKPIAASRKA